MQLSKLHIHKHSWKTKIIKFFGVDCFCSKTVYIIFLNVIFFLQYFYSSSFLRYITRINKKMMTITEPTVGRSPSGTKGKGSVLTNVSYLRNVPLSAFHSLSAFRPNVTFCMVPTGGGTGGVGQKVESRWRSAENVYVYVDLPWPDMKTVLPWWWCY